MTWADQRLTVENIKRHPWFFGADWDSLRFIAPPFVPALQSITDTSYFPTDDLGNMPDQLEVHEGLGSEKDLAFLGYIHHFKVSFLALTAGLCFQIHLQEVHGRASAISAAAGLSCFHFALDCNVVAYANVRTNTYPASLTLSAHFRIL